MKCWKIAINPKTNKKKTSTELQIIGSFCTKSKTGSLVGQRFKKWLESGFHQPSMIPKPVLSEILCRLVILQNFINGLENKDASSERFTHKYIHVYINIYIYIWNMFFSNFSNFSYLVGEWCGCYPHWDHQEGSDHQHSPSQLTCEEPFFYRAFLKCDATQGEFLYHLKFVC